MSRAATWSNEDQRRQRNSGEIWAKLFHHWLRHATLTFLRSA